jgi:hypothetical protein
MIKTIFAGLVFAPVLPTGLFVTALALFVAYWYATLRQDIYNLAIVVEIYSDGNLLTIGLAHHTYHSVVRATRDLIRRYDVYPALVWGRPPHQPLRHGTRPLCRLLVRARSIRASQRLAGIHTLDCPCL